MKSSVTTGACRRFCPKSGCASHIAVERRRLAKVVLTPAVKALEPLVRTANSQRKNLTLSTPSTANKTPSRNHPGNNDREKSFQASQLPCGYKHPSGQASQRQSDRPPVTTPPLRRLRNSWWKDCQWNRPDVGYAWVKRQKIIRSLPRVIIPVVALFRHGAGATIGLEVGKQCGNGVGHVPATR